LIAFAARTENGIAAILFYMLVYALMNIGAFTIVALMARDGEQKLNIDDYAGIGFKQPFLAASLSIFLLFALPLNRAWSGLPSSVCSIARYPFTIICGSSL
jgi:NADH:ubiquinone oxidoreductase subunit 2 (subunit N)